MHDFFDAFKFGLIDPPTTELAALACPKCTPLTYLRTIKNILIALIAGSQVSNLCPWDLLHFCRSLRKHAHAIYSNISRL